MSIIPNDTLKPAESDTMKTFEIHLVMGTSPFINDFFNERLAFWKSLVIRNLQPTFNLTYRTLPNDTLKPLPPLSERPIQGWGSFLEIVTADPSPDVEIDYIGVSLQEALIK